MARGDRATVPVEIVIEHVRILRASMSNRRIAASAGLSYSTFNDVLYRKPLRAKRTHVTQATADKLLAVTAPAGPESEGGNA